MTEASFNAIRWRFIGATFCLFVLPLASFGIPTMIRPFPITVIAHRGASGYLPEHTLPAASMAYAMGANYIEQDCVLSKDDRVIVLHDIHLDSVTDVAKKFPDRMRKDGRFYAIDFTLAEIKTLKVNERVNLKTVQPYFPNRYPATGSSTLRVPTLAEEIELIQGLNKSTGRSVGIYPEVKKPSWHNGEGHDISKIVLQVLTKYGYTKRSDLAFVQCFEPDETRRIRNELKSDLKLIHLTSEPISAEQFQSIAQFADGVGPKINLLVKDPNAKSAEPGDFIELAHRNKLKVHPWTHRKDKLPPFFKDSNQLLEFLFLKVGADGVFTDFPDLAADYVSRMDQ